MSAFEIYVGLSLTVSRQYVYCTMYTFLANEFFGTEIFLEADERLPGDRSKRKPK